MLTAGHNIYDRETGVTPFRIEFAPGMSLGKYAHVNGIPQRFTVSRAILHEGYTSSNKQIAVSSDMAILELNEPVVNNWGTFGFNDPFDDKGTESLKVNVTGYPGDPGDCKSMYTMEGPVVNIGEDRVFYNIDTSRGQSGSGVWSKDEEDDYSCHAVHTKGFSSDLCWGSKQRYNSGVRLTDEKIAFLEKHIDSQ